MQTLYADFGRQIGKIKEVNGVNNGPLTARFTIDHTQDFREVRIPYSRLHDTEGSMGSGEFVNIHCVFPDFNADPELETSYRFEYTDLYLKAIQNAGTKVFYRLGETIENNFKFIRTYTHPPKDFKKWAKYARGLSVITMKAGPMGFIWGSNTGKFGTSRTAFRIGRAHRKNSMNCTQSRHGI